MPFPADHALQLLSRAHEQGRLGHAYLITGPKEAAHEVFANRVLGLVTTQSRRSLDDWSGHGAIILRPQSKSRRIIIGEDGDDPGTIRFLEKNLRQAVTAGAWKLGVIVDAERMNVQAQNAFLKTLEEPPPRTLLLLLTTQPDQLLPTIQSRVIEISLMAPPGARSFNKHEQQLLFMLEKLSSRSTGTLAGALALKAAFEEILENLHEDLKSKHEAAFEREQEHYKQTTDGVWLKQREEQVEAVIEADYLQERTSLMDLMLAWIGDVARQQAGSPHLDLPQHQAATASLAEKWTPQDVTRRVQSLRKLESHLHTNVNESLALEVSFIQAFGA
jgi:DNA polymerase III subunit delta'